MGTTISIIDEILQDREKGAARLVAEYGERLYGVAMALCKDASEAEDLVFRTFEQVLDKVDTCGNEDSFYSWMCAILRNFHRLSVRRPVNRYTEPVGGEAEIDLLTGGFEADVVARTVDSGILRQCIEEMPPKMREMLILHYFLDLPVSQIARYLMMPTGTVLSRLHYARRALAVRLGTNLKKPAVAMVAAALFFIVSVAAVVVGKSVFEKSAQEDSGNSAEVVLATPGENGENAGLNKAMQADAAAVAKEASIKDPKGEKNMNTRQMTAALMAAAALGTAQSDAETLGGALTSESYVQQGLVAQWDGIDNAIADGHRTHNASATVWKDLVGNRDLALTENGSWSANGNALVANGIAAKCAGSAPEYKTIEVVYRRTSDNGRILFSGGAVNQFVIFDKQGGGTNNLYYSGVRNTLLCKYTYNASEILFAAAQYDDSGAVNGLYMDGESVTTSRKNDTWSASEGISVGGRYHSIYGSNDWYGEIYAIRLYNRRLTAYEMAHNYRVDCKRFLTSRSYVQGGLLGHWDGIDNAGVGVHDSYATKWKNLSPARLSLASDGVDLTIQSGLWKDTSLECVGNTTPAASSTTNFTFNTLETVYYKDLSTSSSAILFSSGYLGGKGKDRYACIGSGYIAWCDIDEKGATSSFDGQAIGGMNSIAWTATGIGYANGQALYMDNFSTGSGWGLGTDTKIVLGCRAGRYENMAPFTGHIYAIRAYKGELSGRQLAFNYKIDEVRFFNRLVWNGSGANVGDGDFVTPGGWRIPDNGRTTRMVPGVGDTAVFPSGNYTVSVKEPWQLGNLELGANVNLSVRIPSGNHETPVLSVSGGVTADKLTKLKIENFDNFEGSVDLIACGVNCRDELLKLVANLQGDYKGRRLRVVKGTRLVFSSPVGFCLTIR